MTLRAGWDTGDWSGLPSVTIHPYDPTWPEQFTRASEEIANALAGVHVRIEHAGSTAVPGLGARPGIDIFIGLADWADWEGCVDRLQELGYGFHFAQSDWVHLTRAGYKLHLIPLGSRRWEDHLLFRDYLRHHPETAAAYHRLKLDLARTHGSDGAGYVEGKSDFVRSVVEQARRKHGRR